MVQRTTVCFCLAAGMALSATVRAATTLESASPIFISRTYRALLADSTGESFAQVAHVRSLPTPSLGKDEALVRVVYAGVNGGCETFRARGEHAFRGNADSSVPFGLGAEGVGIVASVGSDVTEPKVGDAVCFVGSAFAEYAKCKASTLWTVPEASPEYVGLRISALTACAMLEGTGKLRRGETVLVTAAAGGAGHFAVQFAKLAGCTVIGTCSSRAKAEVLKVLGCDHVVNHRTQDVGKELKRLAPEGVDVAFEGVGGGMLQIALDALSPTGRLLQVGYISEYPHNPKASDETSRNELDASKLFWGSETVKRGGQTIYGNAWPKDSGAVVGRKDRVLNLYAEGKFESLVDNTATFSGLESVSAAIDHMLGGTSIGKVVVKIS